MKYIKLAASFNFGEVTSVIIASILLPFLPITPIQLLVQSLLYDIGQLTLPFDNVDIEYLKEPKNIKIKAKELTVDRIEQISLEVKQAMKDDTVMRLIDLNNPKKAVVFCNTKKKVDDLIEKLKSKRYKAES